MKESNPLVSIIMSTYNEKKDWLIESINSILTQSYENFEFIIIIDNPNNKELIKLIEMYRNSDERIKCFINEENKGLVYSLNYALSKAKGDYIARMDADDISNYQRLEIQLDNLLSNNIDILGTNIAYFTDNDLIKSSSLPLHNEEIKKEIKKWSQLAHPTWLVKKNVYEKLKGYRYIMYCEDYDFLLRAISEGFILGNTKEILLKYRVNEKSISRSNLLEQRVISRFLSNNLNRINEIDIAEIDKYLKKLNITKKKKLKYEKANNYYQNYCMEKNKIKKYLYLLKSIMVSYLHFKLEYLPNIIHRHC